MSGAGSRVVRHLGPDSFRWEGVEPRAYTDDRRARYRGVLRHALLGEGEGEEALSFVTRYFEVAPGGHSALERHEHPHAVVVLRGAGEVVLDGGSHALGPLDCVYVAPWTPHQFRAAADEPLGFLCMVDRERDRPRRLETAPPGPEDEGAAR